MNVMIYGLREDEAAYARAYGEKFGFTLHSSHEILKESTAHLAKGCDAAMISVSCSVNAKVAKMLRDGGVRYLLTRSAGIDHMDVDSILSLGIQIANVPAYSPNAVSEHTVMMTLELLRHGLEQQRRIRAHDFSIEGMCGREIHNLTTGIVGTGRIGGAAVENFHGFGGKLLAYDLYPSEKVSKMATYLPLEEVYRQSDILVFLCPLTPQTYHMVDQKTLSKMKDGVLLVNTTRGGLFEWNDVLQGLESGKVGGLAFDVIEGERPFVRKDMSGQRIDHPQFLRLLELPNVVYTTHVAFYTDEAVENMVGIAFENLYHFYTEGRCSNSVLHP